MTCMHDNFDFLDYSLCVLILEFKSKNIFQNIADAEKAGNNEVRK